MPVFDGTTPTYQEKLVDGILSTGERWGDSLPRSIRGVNVSSNDEQLHHPWSVLGVEDAGFGE